MELTSTLNIATDRYSGVCVRVCVPSFTFLSLCIAFILQMGPKYAPRLAGGTEAQRPTNQDSILVCLAMSSIALAALCPTHINPSSLPSPIIGVRPHIGSWISVCVGGLPLSAFPCPLPGVRAGGGGSDRSCLPQGNQVRGGPGHHRRRADGTDGRNGAVSAEAAHRRQRRRSAACMYSPQQLLPSTCGRPVWGT